jgi:pimeloyl-[acyl-carrier protein] methyl ester esterase
MKLHVETIGSGPNLTLLHGWGLNGAVWDSSRERLAAKFTLHLVDLPGHGHSASVHLATLDEFAAAVTASAPPGHLLGWSLGGQLALAIAAREPLFVDKLVLIGTTPKFVEADDWAYGKKLAVLDQFAGELAANYAATIRRFLALQTLQAPHARATISRLQTAVTARGTPDNASLMAGLTLLRSNDLRDLAGNTRQPTLILQGARDALTAERAARWLSEKMPSCTYKLFNDAAHAPFLSHEDDFVDALVGFLAA